MPGKSKINWRQESVLEFCEKGLKSAHGRRTFAAVGEFGIAPRAPGASIRPAQPGGAGAGEAVDAVAGDSAEGVADGGDDGTGPDQGDECETAALSMKAPSAKPASSRETSSSNFGMSPRFNAKEQGREGAERT